MTLLLDIATGALAVLFAACLLHALQAGRKPSRPEPDERRQHRN